MEETEEHKFHLFTGLLAKAAQSFLTVPRTLRLVFSPGPTAGEHSDKRARGLFTLD